MARKKESYEDKIVKLENLLEKMEKEELTLEECISKYEEGMKLYGDIYNLLQEAEGKIKIFTEQGEGNFQLEN